MYLRHDHQSCGRTGNTLTKSSPTTGWNAGAVSTQSIPTGDGSVQITLVSTSTYAMFGLATGNADTSYADIDFALYTYPVDQRLRVYENGTNKGAFGSYATGDVLKVAVERGVVKYYLNSTAFYTSTIAPTYPLLLDTAIYSPGGQLANAYLCASCAAVTWTAQVGTTATGATLTKSGATAGWNAGAVSSQAILAGDGYVQARLVSTSTYAMFGLGTANSGVAYSDIDFAVYTYPVDQRLRVYENGTNKGAFGSYTTGDVLQVGVSSGVVRYYLNGTAFYTSTIVPAYPLHLDSALYSPGATLADAALCTHCVGPAWTGLVNVTTSGATLTKSSATAGWNAGAASVESLVAGDGYVQTRIVSTSTYAMVGLGVGNSGVGYTDIDYAVYPYPGDQKLRVYENGVLRGAFDSYTVGDLLAVAVENGVVRYYHNGVVFYSSTVPPSYPLGVDTSIHTPGGQVAEVLLCGACTVTGGTAPAASAPAHPVAAPRPPSAAAPPPEHLPAAPSK